MLTLSLAPMVIGFMVVGFLLVSLLMILIVLIQRPQGGGLSEAFGSNSGSGHTAFGAKTGDALTTATIGIFILFIVASIALNFATRPGAVSPQAQASPVPGEPEGEEQQQPAQPGGQPAPGQAIPFTVQGGTVQEAENPFESGEAQLVDENGQALPAPGEGGDEPPAEEPASEDPGSQEDPE